MSAGEDWDAVAADPDFAAQPMATKNKVALAFYHQRIAPGLPADATDDARHAFFSEAFPAPAPAPTVVNNVTSAIERRIPSAVDYVAKEGPPIVGGTLGAIAGAPGGPATMIAGAALGGAAGRGLQRDVEYATGARDPNQDTALGNAADIATSGLAQGAAEGTGQAGMAIARRLAPGAAKLAGGLATIGPNVPGKYGEAVFKDPSILNRGFSPAAMSDQYQAFQRYTGLQGLEDVLVKSGRATAPTSELEGIVINTANKVASGATVDPQELYVASQAASRLKLAARMGEPQAQMAAASSAISQGKDAVDAALEKIYPEYGVLRRQNFESNAREAFGTILPQTKNMTPAMLRAYTAAAAAVGGAVEGHPAAAVGLPLVSPAAWGLGIRAGALAAPIARRLAGVGLNAGAQTLADSPTP